MGDWVLDGGRPSVDLLNTVRDRATGGRETLGTPADLLAWLRDADLYEGERGAVPADLTAARRLRAAIDLLTGLSQTPEAPVATPEQAVEVVNSMAAGARLVPVLALDAAGRPVAVSPEPSVAAALARVAGDAIDLFAGPDLLRVCGADDCGIRFVDRSPARNRQWCSMRRCGNRTKARRHYDRVRPARTPRRDGP